MGNEGITASGPLAYVPLLGGGLEVEHLEWSERSGRQTCTFEVAVHEELAATTFFGRESAFRGAAVPLGVDGVPATRPYRYDHPVGLEFPRDRWAGALADAIDEIKDLASGRGLAVVIEHDMVGVVDTEPDLHRDPVAIAHTLADSLLVRAEQGELSAPAGTDPATPPELAYLGRFIDGIVVPYGAAPGAVRIHRREPFGPEVESRMAVTWRGAAPDEAAFISLRTSAIDGRIDDEHLASRALAGVVGDVRGAVLGVALAADGARALVGIDDPTGRHDADVALAADRLRDRWPLPARSPGLAALAPYVEGPDGSVDVTDPSWLGRVTSAHGCSSTTVEQGGPDGSTLVAAWFTRQRPGPSVLVDLDVGPDGVDVVVRGGNDDELAAAAQAFATTTPRVAPSRIHATADLVLAVGWQREEATARRRRFGRRSATAESSGPDEEVLVALLTSIPRHDVHSR